MPSAIRLVESGQLDLAPMISAVLPLAEAAAGIAMLRSGEGIKVVITP